MAISKGRRKALTLMAKQGKLGIKARKKHGITATAPKRRRKVIAKN